jgi:hypothetical protein
MNVSMSNRYFSFSSRSYYGFGYFTLNKYGYQRSWVA